MKSRQLENENGKLVNTLIKLKIVNMNLERKIKNEKLIVAATLRKYRLVEEELQL